MKITNIIIMKKSVDGYHMVTQNRGTGTPGPGLE